MMYEVMLKCHFKLAKHFSHFIKTVVFGYWVNSIMNLRGISGFSHKFYLVKAQVNKLITIGGNIQILSLIYSK